MSPSFEDAWAQRRTVARRPDAAGLFVALAPMDGITDSVYREVMTDIADGHSGISICVSEFVRVTREPVGERTLLRHCPELARGGTTRAGVPVFVQILGGEPEPMAQTARRAAELGAPGVDINFGCPAKTVNNSDGGATILKCPGRVERITSAVRAAVPPAIPVTVKIRLGWQDADTVADIARAAQAGGADWLTIHARTRAQLYRPPVDWAALDRARRAVTFPVVANGDVDSVAALRACGGTTGCSAFMIGRGAMGRPRLFRALRGHEEPELDLPWLGDLLRDYVARLRAHGAGDHAALGRLKQWLRLGATAFAAIADVFEATKRGSDLAVALAQLPKAPRAAVTPPRRTRSTPAADRPRPPPMSFRAACPGRSRGS